MNLAGELVNSLFSSHLEWHAFQLGVVVGTIVAAIWNRYPRVAVALLCFSVVVSFGAPTFALRVVVRKPWYFLTPLAVVTVVGPSVPAVLRWALPAWVRRDGPAEADAERPSGPESD